MSLVNVNGTICEDGESTKNFTNQSLNFKGNLTLTAQEILQASSLQLKFQPGGTGNSVFFSTSNPAGGDESVVIPDFGVSAVNMVSSIAVVNNITTTITLNAGNSKQLHNITSAAPYTITLPNPNLANSMSFLFVIKAALSGGAVTISSTGANIIGNVISSDGTSVTGGNVSTAKTSIVLGTTALAGDTYELISNGTNYILRGMTSVHGSVTFTP